MRHLRKYGWEIALGASASALLALALTACTPKGKQVVSDVGACVQPIAPDLYKTVVEILFSNGADWQAAIAQLPQDVGAVICAVKAVVTDLKTQAAAVAHGQVDPRVSTAIKRGGDWLASKGVHAAAPAESQFPATLTLGGNRWGTNGATSQAGTGQ